ncbi:MAG TPA: xanthine dehydrogenase family protein subunit M [Baekduia sp.]|nr:xanthine dehydrogenase family protein subunit M [Baekduia sp.]
MIPPEFDYVRVSSVEEAVSVLAADEEAKLLAGGHSLVPLMKLRLAAPTQLVDIGRVPGLDAIERSNGDWRIGALARHAQLQDRPDMGLASRVAASIADQQVRNRGTIGGSLAHGDPASDLPAVLLACEGRVVARGTGGEREIAAADFFRDYLTTALEPSEVVTEIRLPALEGWGFAHRKFTRRAEDWAMVGVCVAVQAEGGVCRDVRIGFTNMGSTPLRATATEEALRGQPLEAASIERAAAQAAEGTDPPADLNATPEYKRHLARVLTGRALREAAGL